MEQHPFRNVLETSNWQFFPPSKILAKTDTAKSDTIPGIYGTLKCVSF